MYRRAVRSKMPRASALLSIRNKQVRHQKRERKLIGTGNEQLRCVNYMYILLIFIILGVLHWERQSTETAPTNQSFTPIMANETIPGSPRLRVLVHKPVITKKNTAAGGGHIDADAGTNYANATVLAMALGYDIQTHQRFIGSLRHAGFVGNIIIAVEDGISSSVQSYLDRQNVVVKVPEMVKCKFLHKDDEDGTDKSHDDDVRTCFDPYPNIKARWSRFPLLRDYLVECENCSGPVLVTDYRDVFFQCNPFHENHRVTGLQVFQEMSSQRTTYWLVDEVMRKCKSMRLVIDEPILCSGTTVGDRDSMIQYLGIMHSEMEKWMEDPKCCCTGMVGDDQYIHNYLFYSGRFPEALAVPNRMGIVNSVGAQGDMIAQAHVRNRVAAGMSPDEAEEAPFDGSDMDSGRWLGLHYDLTDSDGFFTNFDGTKSCVVHQYDRFGSQFEAWMQDMMYELWADINDECDHGSERESRASKDDDNSRQNVFVFPPNLNEDEHKHIFVDGIIQSTRLDLSLDICDRNSYWFVDINRCTKNQLKRAMRKKNSTIVNYKRNAVIVVLVDWSDYGREELELAELFLLASDFFGSGNVRFVTRQFMDNRNIQNISNDKEFSNYGIKWSWDKEGKEFGLGGRIKVARYPVRSDLVSSISNISGIKLDGSPASTSAISKRLRSKDVVSFWNTDDVTDPMQEDELTTELRGSVSKLVASLGKGKGKTRLKATAGLFGERESEGRNNIDDAYVRALLNHKIVVVAQRDRWEGHYRLMEALSGGALVMSDPMHPFPYLILDGENIVVYSSLDDLKEKIRYYIRNERERLEIAARGHHVAMNHHRSWHVMERIVLGNWTSDNF